jgi:hypothetical protein
VMDDYALAKFDVRRDDTELSGHRVGNRRRVQGTSRRLIYLQVFARGECRAELRFHRVS